MVRGDNGWVGQVWTQKQRQEHLENSTGAADLGLQPYVQTVQTTTRQGAKQEASGELRRGWFAGVPRVVVHECASGHWGTRAPKHLEAGVSGAQTGKDRTGMGTREGKRMPGTGPSTGRRMGDE